MVCDLPVYIIGSDFINLAGNSNCLCCVVTGASVTIGDGTLKFTLGEIV